jgi:hypothetical protein
MAVKYFFLPMLSSLPLYAMAGDSGRWFAVGCINYSMISLCKEINYVEFGIAKAYKSRLVTLIEKCRSWNKPLANQYEAWGFVSALLILLFVMFYIRLPHCCIRSAFLAEPLRSLVRNILGYLDPSLRQ